jgi:predicted amidophosphoribosyltransferase
MADEPADLYVSCVEGQPVARFGSRVMIGADRTVEGITYRPEEIVKIPAGEWRRYRREYTRQLNDGALRKRTATEWDTQSKRHADAQEQAEREKQARRKKREAESVAATKSKE